MFLKKLTMILPKTKVKERNNLLSKTKGTTKKIPMRRCIGCMESIPKKELIRFVAKEAQAEIDPSGKANGRGVYLCRKEECFDKAMKKRALSRGLDIDAIDGEKQEVLKAEFARVIAGGEVSE